MTGVLVAGGGVAGSAAACLLAQGGHAVTLIERETGPVHKICGEFISHEAGQYLAGLGLDLAGLGARPITHVRLVRGGDVAEARLPFAAQSLTRRTLDEALLHRAAAAGVAVRRGHAVRAIAGGVVDVAGLGALRPAALFLATGKHDLHGLRRAVPRLAADLVGFKMYFVLSPAQSRALAGCVEVMLFADGYAGLQMVEGGQANLCLLTSRARLAAAGGAWPALLADLQRECAHLARRLDAATPVLDQPLAIARVPYGFIHAARRADPPDVFRLGDQAGVIPSFSGDGMSMALHSAHAASAAFLAGQGAYAYHRRFAADIAVQMRVAQAAYRVGRSPLGQTLLMATARLWPGSLRLIAGLTRVPEGVLLGA